MYYKIRVSTRIFYYIDMDTLVDFIKKNNREDLVIDVYGDVLYHTKLHKYLKENNLSIKDIISDIYINPLHLNFYNQETIPHKEPIRYGNKDLEINGHIHAHFDGPVSIANDMLDKGFNMISLANNHTLDAGYDKLKEVYDFWKDKKDVIVDGIRFEEEEYNPIYIHNGVRIAFFSWTDRINAKYNDPSCLYSRNDFVSGKVKKEIDKVRDKVDLIIVSMHWGTEYSFEVDDRQKEISKFLSDLGVDIIIGHHPHCIQPIRMIGKTLCIYSLGNFIAFQERGDERTQIGMHVQISYSKARGISYEYDLNYILKDDSRFKVVPFSKLDNDILPGYKGKEIYYLNKAR